MVITRQRVQEILVNDMQLDENDVEVLEYYIMKEETLTPDEARALNDVHGVIRSYMGGKRIEAMLHMEMMRLGGSRKFFRVRADFSRAT